MTSRQFFNKKIDLAKANLLENAQYIEPNSANGLDNAIVDIQLLNYESENITDKFGFTGYSLVLYLQGNKIVEIERIAHLDMCGQGCDYERRRFPYQSLEIESYEKLSSLIIK